MSTVLRNKPHILCISETSQKENVDFAANVSIVGYNKPYTLGSKTARGGVAIFTKDDLTAIERTDMNLVNTSFEALWIEIKQKKSQRHHMWKYL